MGRNDDKKRNLIIFFASVSLKTLSRRRNRERDALYAMCLAQLKRVVGKTSWEILVAENTLGNASRFGASLLGEEARGLRTVVLSENRGSRNKGLGEIDMLLRVTREIELTDFSNVAYFSGRRLMTSPYLLRMAEDHEGSILAGNPPFLYLDGEYSPPSDGPMLADMFFTMPPQLMIKYAESCLSQIQAGLRRGIGSEQLLFQFLMRENLSYVPIYNYGFVRLEMSSRRGRWHIC